MKKAIAAAALLGIAGLAMAEGEAVVIDISGVESWDLEGDASNTILNVDLASAVGLPAGSPVTITGIGWDVTYETVGASWLSESTISFGDTLGAPSLFLTPSGTGAPGIESNASDGILKLVDLGLEDIPVTDGVVDIEFFETFDDVADEVDGFYQTGSTLTLQVVPAPGAMALLGLAGVAARRRRRG